MLLIVAVGKTSSVLRYIHQTFSDEVRGTVGASFLTQKMYGHRDYEAVATQCD